MKRFLVALLSTCLAPSAGAQIGTVLGEHKISSTSGGFAGPLRDNDYFGRSLAGLGDLDGDGVVDLAVGAPFDDDGGQNRGAVWILFLDPSGSVRSSRKISSLTGFPGTLADNGGFGSGLAALGDVDGDGIQDLAVGAPDVQTVWFCLLRRDGSVRLARSTTPADVFYNPPIQPQERLGAALASLGDIDGNGVTDLAVYGQMGCCPPGPTTIWLLRLTPFATVAAAQQVASSATGLLAGQRFGPNVGVADVDADGDFDLLTQGIGLLELVLDSGHNLVRVDQVLPANLELYWSLPRYAGGIGGLLWAGDLDGDGGGELWMGAPQWKVSDVATAMRGALITAFTRPIGPPRRSVLVSANRGGFGGTLPSNGYFGMSLASLGDLDGDGVGDLAVGAPGDSDGGVARGAVWILALDGSPLRNGSGANPMTLSEVTPPVMARSWQVDLDCGAHAPSLSLLAGYAAGQAGLPSVAGEVLVDPASVQLFRLIQPHAGAASRFTMPIPVDAALISLQLSLQGMCAGLPGPRLSNALDEVLSVP